MENLLLQLAKFGYIGLIIVIAIVLAFKNLNDIGMAAIYALVHLWDWQSWDTSFSNG